MAFLKRHNRTALILALAGVFTAAGMAVGYMSPFDTLRTLRSNAPRKPLRAGGGLSHPPMGVLDALRAARFISVNNTALPLRNACPRINQDTNRRIEHAGQLADWRAPLSPRDLFPAPEGSTFPSPRYYPPLQPVIPESPDIDSGNSDLDGEKSWAYLGLNNSTGEEKAGNGSSPGDTGTGGQAPGSGGNTNGSDPKSEGDHGTNPTPIPGSAWMMGSGLAALIWMRRKKCN